MLRATRTAAAGTYPASAVADHVELDHEDRCRRRLTMSGRAGTLFLVDLAETPALRDGDGYVLEDGRVIAIAAKPERLVEVRSADPYLLARVAWHLGNRHLPTQILGTKLRIRRDHVIEDMVRGLGADVKEIEAPFDPEGGAYAQHVATHGHDHGHGHDRHDHDHAHDDHCGCGHDHDHGHGHGHDAHHGHKHD